MSTKESYTFSCDKCVFVVDSEDEFNNHYKAYHKNEAINFCKGCGKVFTVLQELIKHIKTTCKKYFSTDLFCGVKDCEFENRNPFKFMEHCKIVHRNITLLPCLNCKKFFTFPSFLVKHIQLECTAKVKKTKESDSSAKKVSTAGAYLPKGVKPATTTKNTFNADLLSKKKPVAEQVAVNAKDKKKEQVGLSTNRKRQSSETAELSKPDVCPKKNWRTMNPFILSVEDSDPDDPTWKPVSPVHKAHNDSKRSRENIGNLNTKLTDMPPKQENGRNELNQHPDSEDECELLAVVDKKATIQVIDLEEETDNVNEERESKVVAPSNVSTEIANSKNEAAARKTEIGCSADITTNEVGKTTSTQIRQQTALKNETTNHVTAVGILPMVTANIQQLKVDCERKENGDKNSKVVTVTHSTVITETVNQQLSVCRKTGSDEGLVSKPGKKLCAKLGRESMAVANTSVAAESETNKLFLLTDKVSETNLANAVIVAVTSDNQQNKETVGVMAAEDKAVATVSAKYREWGHWRSDVMSCKSFDAFDCLHEKKHLPHFFKCMSYYCNFTTDYERLFEDHLLSEHQNETLPCIYCLEKFEANKMLINHMMLFHGTRIYQCGTCLYRAMSKRHIQYHFQEMHKTSDKVVYHTCNPYIGNSREKPKQSVILPYCCGLKDCQYKNNFPDDFLSHINECHPAETEFICPYCKKKMQTTNDLMNHLIVHGISKVQCCYCIFAADNYFDVIQHICLNHPDFNIEVFERRKDSSKLSSRDPNVNSWKEKCVSNVLENCTEPPDKSSEHVQILAFSISSAVSESPSQSNIQEENICRQSSPDIEMVPQSQGELSDIYLLKNVLVSNVKIEQEDPTFEHKSEEAVVGDVIEKALTQCDSVALASTIKFEPSIVSVTSTQQSENDEKAGPNVSSFYPSKSFKTETSTATLFPNSKDLSSPSISSSNKEAAHSDPVAPMGHAARTQNGQIFDLECDKCLFRTDDLDLLEDHYTSLHKKQIYFFCRKCGIVYFSIETLMAHHAKKCPGVKLIVLKCGIPSCEFSSTGPMELMEHFKFFHRGTSLFPCWNCSRFFTFPAFLVQHIQEECPYKRLIPEKRRCGSKPAPKRFKQASECIDSSSSNDETPPADLGDRCKASSPATLEGISPAESDEDSNDGKTEVASCEKSVQMTTERKNDSKRKRKKASHKKSGRKAGTKNASKNVASKEEAKSKKTALISRQSLRVAGLPPLFDPETETSTIHKGRTEVISSSKNDNNTTEVEMKNGNNTREVEMRDNGNNTREVEMKDNNTREVIVKNHNNTREVEMKNGNNTREVKMRDNNTSEVIVKNHNNTREVEMKNHNNMRKVELAPSCASSSVTSNEKSNDVVSSCTVAPDDKWRTEGQKRGTPMRLKMWSDWSLIIISRKSSKALEALRQDQSVRHFFACMHYGCEFSADDPILFFEHLLQVHAKTKQPCRFCFQKFEAGKALVKHTVAHHARRVFQCSSCLYRAASELHVKLHFEAMHGHTDSPVIYRCPAVEGGSVQPLPEHQEVVLPYVCCAEKCNFRTDYVAVFSKHCKDVHGDVESHACAYCKLEVDSVDSLIEHLTVHGLDIYQCAYCIFGSGEVLDVLVHQCLNHADFELKTCIRPGKVREETNPNAQYAFDKEACPPKHVFNTIDSFPCGVDGCGHSSNDATVYEEHLERVHGFKTFSCPHCVEIFLTFPSFKEHLLLHGPNLYMCSTAGCRFMHYDKKYIEDHCKDVHKSRIPHATTIREKCPGLVLGNDREEAPREDRETVVQNSTVSTTVTAEECDARESPELTPATKDVDSSEEEEEEESDGEPPTLLPEVEDTVGFSWYRKDLPKIDFSKITVITPQSEALGIKIPFIDYVKLSSMGHRRMKIILKDLKEHFA